MALPSSLRRRIKEYLENYADSDYDAVDARFRSGRYGDFKFQHDTDQSRFEITHVPTGSTVYVPEGNSGEIPSSGSSAVTWYDHRVTDANSWDSAMNNLSAGETVWVDTRSDFEVNQSHTVTVNDVTIIGNHYRKTELYSTGPNILEFNDCHRARVSRIHLEGRDNNSDLLTFSTSSGNITYNHMVHDVRLADSAGNGLYINGNIHDSTFKRVECYGVGDDSNSAYNLNVSGGSENCRGNNFIDLRLERNVNTSTAGGNMYFENLTNSQIVGAKVHADDTAANNGLVESAGGNHRVGFIGCYFFTLQSGETLVNWTDNDQGRVVGCQFYGDADIALNISGNKLITSNYFRGGGGNDHLVCDGQHNLINANKFMDSPTNDSIRLTAGSDNTLVSDNHLTDGGTLTNNGGSGNVVTDNVGG